MIHNDFGGLNDRLPKKILHLVSYKSFISDPFLILIYKVGKCLIFWSLHTNLP